MVAMGEGRRGGRERRHGGEAAECEGTVGSSAIELGRVGIGVSEARYALLSIWTLRLRSVYRG
jgi:hypothetical protein